MWSLCGCPGEAMCSKIYSRTMALCSQEPEFESLTLFSAESLTLSEIAAHLNEDTLKRLRNECGGLQTLLRNSHQVFEGKNEKRSVLFPDVLHTNSCLLPP